MSKMKDPVFHGKTKQELQALPQPVLEKFVFDLDRMRHGLSPLSPSKPMQGLGKGVMELKKNGKPAYRLVYVIVGGDIHILHVFTKTSNGTDSKHEDRIKKRYKSIA